MYKLFGIGFGFLIIGMVMLAFTRPNEKEQPNIILLVTDDQRWDALGYAGNAIIHTPEMDRLAKEGAYFKNAFVTTPICAASRASIITGWYERNHHYTFTQPPIQNRLFKKSYIYQLRKTGYQTGFIGKWGIQADDKWINKAFDVFRPNNQGTYFRLVNDGKEHRHLTEVIGDETLEFLEDQNGITPFCLSVSFHAPHASDASIMQYIWPESMDSLYRGMNIPAPVQSADDDFNKLPTDVQNGFNRDRWKWRFDTPEKYQTMVKGYYRMISGVDYQIGRIRAKLKEKNLDKNTVIILIGDNGYFLGERQIAGKWLLYERSIRVPLIIYDPRFAPVDIDEIALNIDLAPTIIALSNTPYDEQDYDGLSLEGFYNPQKNAPNRDAFLCEHLWQFEHIPPSEGIRTKRYKYFRYINTPTWEEVYDLELDPSEMNNLVQAPDQSELVEKLRNQFTKLNKTVQRH